MKEMLLKAGTVIVGDGTIANDVFLLIQEGKIVKIGLDVEGSGK
ncbi:MAG: hypothetical protein ACFFER_12455 [Candidatus Thorarchaeota archaeon]